MQEEISWKAQQIEIGHGAQHLDMEILPHLTIIHQARNTDARQISTIADSRQKQNLSRKLDARRDNDFRIRLEREGLAILNKVDAVLAVLSDLNVGDLRTEIDVDVGI